MTAQESDLFIYRSAAYESDEEPLTQLLEQRGLERRYFNRSVSSSCWRGYKAVWQVTKSRLYLIALADPLDDEIDLSVVFPECETRVFAYWFSGTIRLPYGAQIDGLGQEMPGPECFEFYHNLEFKNGILIRAEDITNDAFEEED